MNNVEKFNKMRPVRAGITAILLIVGLMILQFVYFFVINALLLALVQDEAVRTNLALCLSLIATAVSMTVFPMLSVRFYYMQRTQNPVAAKRLWREFFGWFALDWRSFRVPLLYFIGFVATSEIVMRLIDINASDFVLPLIQTLPLWLIAVMVVLAAPIYEEIVFRGVLWQLFDRVLDRFKYKVLLKSIIISLIFALIHLQYSSVEMLFIVALSLILCYARHRCGTIIAPILLHCVNNSLALISVFL